MEDDIFKIMIIHKDKVVRKIIKNEILKYLPKTLFITASGKKSFYKKIQWLTPDLILSIITDRGFLTLEVLLYVRKNLESIPFIFLMNQSQKKNNSLSSIFESENNIVNYDKPTLIPQAIGNILPKIKGYKQSKKIEQLELYQQLLLIQKSIALSTKGYLTDQIENDLKSPTKI